MKFMVVIWTFLIFASLAFASNQGVFVSQSDYISEPYEFVSYVSARSTPNPYKYLQENIPKFVDQCINALIGQANQRSANGILSLGWEIIVQSENNKWYAIECHGMAIKLQR